MEMRVIMKIMVLIMVEEKRNLLDILNHYLPRRKCCKEKFCLDIPL